MASKVARTLYRSIQKEIRGLTRSGSKIFLLEAPDHRKWGHGQVGLPVVLQGAAVGQSIDLHIRMHIRALFWHGRAYARVRVR